MTTTAKKKNPTFDFPIYHYPRPPGAPGLMYVGTFTMSVSALSFPLLSSYTKYSFLEQATTWSYKQLVKPMTLCYQWVWNLNNLKGQLWNLLLCLFMIYNTFTTFCILLTPPQYLVNAWYIEGPVWWEEIKLHPRN